MKDKVLGELLDELNALRRKLDIFGGDDRFRTLFESVNDAIFLLDLKGNFIDINRTAYERLGYTKKEMLSMHVNDLIPEELAGRVPGHLKQPGNNKNLMFESYHLRKDGTTMPVEVNARTVDFGGEKMILSVIRDTTDRKEAEGALKKAYEQLELRAEERTKQLGLLQEINTAMNMGMSLKDVMQITVDGVRDIFDYPACAIYLLDDAGENLVLSAISADSSILKNIEKLTGLAIPGYRIPLFRESHFTKVVREKKLSINHNTVKVFEDFTDDKRLRALAGRVSRIAGFKSSMEVPLIAEDTVIGVIGVSSKETIVEEDARVIRRFASQIALIIKKGRLEEELRQSEEKYRSIIDNIIDVYYRGNLEGGLVMASPSAAKFFGYSSVEEMIGMNIAETFYYNPDERGLLLKELNEHGKVVGYRVTLKRKDGTKIPVETTSYFVYDEEGNPVAVEGIFRDITERKRAEDEMKRRLMKFQMENGNLYMVKEPTADMSLRAFEDLLFVGYPGLIISRTPGEQFIDTVEGVFEFLWLAESGGKKALTPRLKEIKARIKNLPRKNAVLIDRLDYLIFKNGFDKTLSFVQRLGELAYLMGLIVILSIDPSTLDKRELRLLEKETLDIEPKSKARLPEDLLEILSYAYEQNTIGIKPSYSEIRKEVGVSKPTVRKRIRNLISSGHVIESKKGMYKVVELTDRGRSLFFG